MAAVELCPDEVDAVVVFDGIRYIFSFDGGVVLGLGAADWEDGEVDFALCAAGYFDSEAGVE